MKDETLFQWDRLKYEVFYSGKLKGSLCSLTMAILCSGLIYSSAGLISKWAVGYLYESNVDVNSIPIDPVRVTERMKYYFSENAYKNESNAKKREYAEGDVKLDLKKEFIKKKLENLEVLLLCVYPIGAFIPFSVMSYINIYRIRKNTEEEAIKAEDSQSERSDIFRQNYIAKHKDEILARTDEIKRKHEERILNTRQREYFDEFVSTKVYQMWDEEYKLWQIATGYYDVPKKEITVKGKDDIVFKEELQRKKKQEDLKIKKLAIETFSQIKGRSVLQSEYKKFEVKILKGRMPRELSEEERRNWEDLKDVYQQSLDRLGNNI